MPIGTNQSRRMSIRANSPRNQLRRIPIRANPLRNGLRMLIEANLSRNQSRMSIRANPSRNRLRRMPIGVNPPNGKIGGLENLGRRNGGEEICCGRREKNVGKGELVLRNTWNSPTML